MINDNQKTFSSLLVCLNIIFESLSIGLTPEKYFIRRR